MADRKKPPAALALRLTGGTVGFAIGLAGVAALRTIEEAWVGIFVFAVTVLASMLVMHAANVRWNPNYRARRH